MLAILLFSDRSRSESILCSQCWYLAQAANLVCAVLCYGAELHDEPTCILFLGYLYDNNRSKDAFIVHDTG